MTDDPYLADRLLERAEYLLDVNRPGDAVKELERALALRPEDSTTLCLLSRSFLLLKDWGRTLEYAQRALAADPQSEWALRLQACGQLGKGKRKAAYKAATRAVGIDPTNAEGLYLLALCAFELDRNDEAEMLGELLVKQHPTLTNGHVILGDAAAVRGDRAAASRHYEKVVELDPQHDRAMAALAGIRSAHSQYGESVSLLRGAVSVNPNRAARHSELRETMNKFALFGEPGRRSRSVAALLATVFVAYTLLGSALGARLGRPDWFLTVYMAGLPIIVIVALPLLRSRFFASQSEQLQKLYRNTTRMQRKRSLLTLMIIIATAYGIAGIVYLDRRDLSVFATPVSLLMTAVWFYMLGVTFRLAALWLSDLWRRVTRRDHREIRDRRRTWLWVLPILGVTSLGGSLAFDSPLAALAFAAIAVISAVCYYRCFPLATSLVATLLGGACFAYDLTANRGSPDAFLVGVGAIVITAGLAALTLAINARYRRHRQRRRIVSLVGGVGAREL